MKTVVYASPYVPAEWIAAHGLRPRLVFPASASGSVREGVCPFAQAFAEAAAGAGAGVVFTTVCDQMRRMAERVARVSRKPVFLMNVPATWQTPAARGLYATELRRLGRFLAGLGGRNHSPARLGAVMRRYDSARAALRKQRRKLSARQYAEALAVFQAGEGVRVEAGAPPAPAAGAVPVAVVGGPVVCEDYRLFDWVEQCGGRVVLNGVEGGERTLPAAFDERRLRADPFAELTRAYFGSIPDVAQRPNAPLYAWLQRELRARRARGLIIWHELWCDLWRAEAPRLAARAGLPALYLDGQGGDLHRARAETRIQAFLETLKRGAS